MFMVTSSGGEAQLSKAYRAMLIKDLFKGALMVIGLQVASSVFLKNQ